jgi:hypothetical protein
MKLLHPPHCRLRFGRLVHPIVMALLLLLATGGMAQQPTSPAGAGSMVSHVLEVGSTLELTVDATITEVAEAEATTPATPPMHFSSRWQVSVLGAGTEGMRDTAWTILESSVEGGPSNLSFMPQALRGVEFRARWNIQGRFLEVRPPALPTPEIELFMAEWFAALQQAGILPATAAASGSPIAGRRLGQLRLGGTLLEEAVDYRGRLDDVEDGVALLGADITGRWNIQQLGATGVVNRRHQLQGRVDVLYDRQAQRITDAELRSNHVVTTAQVRLQGHGQNQERVAIEDQRSVDWHVVMALSEVMPAPAASAP